ncbi:MAG TPA: DsbA family protein [Candidatus Nanoarchaeia archaeon]|nr:DsbA family protein [Candidatus Nanoarchaeia archaeon]
MIIRKRWIISVVIIIALIIAYNVFSSASYPEINTPKPVFGNENAKVSIIEFSDLQCPACKSAHPVVQRIKNEYKDKISFEYYHYPLRAAHPYAQKAAEAVECANDQGKFFEYIDAAFIQSPDLQKKNLKIIAARLGLDTEKFDNCLDSGAKAKVVEGDIRLGDAKNVQGTPSFFINDKLLDSWQYDSFKAAIERELR